MSQGDERRRPDLFIIGAPKAGTTSLYDYLKGHPQVYMSPVKEPGYFSPDVPAPRNRFQHGRDLERYLALFAGATDEKRLGEASTYYLYSRLAPRLIREFEADARIVVILRNPVDMAYALHGQRVAHDAEPIADFEQALDADLAPDFGGATRRGMIERAGTYRERARYGEQLPRWHETFGRDRVCVLILDDLIADPAGEFRKLLEFLEVDESYRPESFAPRNVSHRRRPVLRAIMESRPAQWTRHRALPAVVGSGNAARFARAFKHSRLVRRRKPRPPLRAEIRRQLEDEFASDVARVSELLGRDLNSLWFGRPARADAPLSHPAAGLDEELAASNPGDTGGPAWRGQGRAPG